MENRLTALRTIVAVVISLSFVGDIPLLAQATTPREFDVDRAEETIQRFEAQDRISMPPPGAIVVTGSSSITRWNDAMVQDLAPLTVIPRGFGGSTMAEALHYVDRIAINYKPRALVVYEGDNDTSYFIPPHTIVDQFESIVSKVHAALPETRIYVLSVKPSVLRRNVWDKAQETNELLKAVVNTNDLLTYVDVATPLLRSDGHVMTDIFVDDGLHLNEKGTRIWAATIRAALMAGEAKYESRNSGN